MKALLRVLVLFFGITGIRTSSFADSGWFWQNPLPQGHRLFGVATSDPSTVIAVGDFGTILRTTDGGTTWTLQRSGSDNSLLAVCFVNADTGWAVGRRGTILHTIDGGATWVPQSSD